jgi:7-carboxy-7-deazaguanine synthase
MKTYRVNEIFYTLQGEGVHAGRPAIFIRFTGCNLQCDLEAGPLSPGGFACDTEFVSGTAMTLEQIVSQVSTSFPSATPGVLAVLTGGEPGLQIDEELVKELQSMGLVVAVETNGTRPIPDCVDWITVSPKVAEHAIAQVTADEVKYVRGYGQGIPKTSVLPRRDKLKQWISPAFDGGYVNRRTLQWCIALCKENPSWSLSVQAHKLWGVR